MTTKLVSTGVEFPDATTQTTSGVPLTGGTMTGALTTTGFTSTGIDDNATSTAITIDASENVAMVGTRLYLGAGGTSGANIEMLRSATNYIKATDVAGALAFGTGGGVSRLTIASGGNVTVDTGNLVIGTAGKGIDFSADGNYSGMSSEVLDDYETGTWTPTASAVTTAPTITYANRTGGYTKVGNMVTAWCYLDSSSISGASGYPLIQGLPFAIDTTDTNFPGVAMGITTGVTGSYDSYIVSDYVRLWGANYSSAGYITFTVTYPTAS